ncbi:hypothetical protein OAS39_00620 [Pirellulales bacterium]|nr:hypothetical protein [Pirellulales bacterium]
MDAIDALKRLQAAQATREAKANAQAAESAARLQLATDYDAAWHRLGRVLCDPDDAALQSSDSKAIAKALRDLAAASKASGNEAMIRAAAERATSEPKADDVDSDQAKLLIAICGVLDDPKRARKIVAELQVGPFPRNVVVECQKRSAQSDTPRASLPAKEDRGVFTTSQLAKHLKASKSALRTYAVKAGIGNRVRGYLYSIDEALAVASEAIRSTDSTINGAAQAFIAQHKG